MPTLTMKRDFPWGLSRKMTVEISAQKRITLGYGEELSIQLPSGSYALIAKMGWTKSNILQITLDESDSKRVRIGCIPLLEAAIKSYIPPFVIYTLSEDS